MPPEWFPGAPDPHWHWLVVVESFVAALATGAFLTAAFATLAGTSADRRATRVGYWLSLPLATVSGLLLTMDLYRPERFHHMLLQSARLPLPIFKPWSPMSLGSWALLLFGGLAFLFAVDAFLARRWGRDTALLGGMLGKLVAIVGVLLAFLVAGYQGALVSVTSQPVWTQSAWFTPLFVVSSVLAGLAVVALFVPSDAATTATKVRAASTWLIVAELVLLVAFLLSLGVMARTYMSPAGLLVLGVGVVLVGLVAPLLLHQRDRGVGHASLAAPILTLLGVLALRYAIWMVPVGAIV